MNKLSRVIFVLLFFVTSFISNRALVRGSLIALPVKGAEEHNSFEVVASSTPPYHSKKEKFPCTSLQITETGAICSGYRLNFPEVKLPDVLQGEGYLPCQSQVISIPEKAINEVIYRNITLKLRWEPATPKFLQIYLKEYLPYWENRIPYRLFWNAQYERCLESCSPRNDQGEFLPTDIENLSPALAADINFNGVPAAFWNQNIKP